jgi:hypothetical protein
MCIYLSLSALHVSDSLVHHQERRFGAVYRNWYKLVRLVVATATARQSPDKQSPDSHIFFISQTISLIIALPNTIIGIMIHNRLEDR